MKRCLLWFLFLLFLATAPAAWAQPQIPPAPTASIYVQDYAGVLNGETKAKINAMGEKLAGQTKAQVVVVTVPSLQNATVEEYSLGILRQWGIGDKNLKNGVLLLLAINDRKSRVEVGYGLEGALPDAKTGRIQDEMLLPYLKQGDYNQGVLRTYTALVGVVAKEYNVEAPQGEGGKVKPPAQHSKEASWWDSLPWWGKILLGAGLIGLFLMDWLLFGGFFTQFLLNLLFFFRGGGGGGRSSGGGSYGGGDGGGGGSSRNW